MLYFETNDNSVDDTELPSNYGWDENYDYRWDKEIYPEDSASFLANASSITHDIDEWYIIDFETDVTYIFKMESEDNDYRVYLKFCCCCYERMLLLIANNLCFCSI